MFPNEDVIPSLPEDLWWQTFFQEGEGTRWRLRELEEGPAKRAGARTYSGEFRSVPLCLSLLTGDLTTEVLSDLSAHSFSSGCRLLIVDDGYLHIRDLFTDAGSEPISLPADDLAELLRVWESLNPPAYPDFRTDTKIIETLKSCLHHLRKIMIAALRREYGDISAMQLETLSTQMITRALFCHATYAHGIDTGFQEKVSWYCQILQFISYLPALDSYDSRATTEICTPFSRENGRIFSQLRLSWIQPVIYARAFTQFLEEYQQKRTKYEPNIMEERHEGPVIAPWLINRIKKSIQERDPHTPTILDPSCRCGEVIAEITPYLLGIIHENSLAKRLAYISSSIYGYDPNPAMLAVSRFVLMMCLIRDKYQGLQEPADNSAFTRIDHHFRVGSILFGTDFKDEFVSAISEHERIKRIHPLDPQDTPENGFDLIISGSSAPLPGESLEIDRYLNRRFKSYTYPGSSMYLLPERTVPLLSPKGTGYYLIPSQWLSEERASAFRGWVKHAPITAIGIGDVGEGTLLIFEPGTGDNITILPVYEPNLQYEISRSDLPSIDGWNLHDPWEDRIIATMENGGQTLAEYVMDEIYQPDQRDERREGWISLSHNGEYIRSSWAESVQEDAIAIIPGNDEYLTSLLSSSLIRMYWQTKRRTRGNSELTIIRSMPVITPDLYGEDQERYNAIILASRHLDSLTRKFQYATAAHDKKRITKRIATVRRERDILISELYAISPRDTEEIIAREKIIGPIDPFIKEGLDRESNPDRGNHNPLG